IAAKQRQQLYQCNLRPSKRHWTTSPFKKQDTPRMPAPQTHRLSRCAPARTTGQVCRRAQPCMPTRVDTPV
ncbi:hypothetical protein L195_g037557, partial [Trifolium pratense]